MLDAKTSPMVCALRQIVDDLDADDSLLEPNRLRERLEALDRLDRFDLGPAEPPEDPVDLALYRRALALQSRWEAANAEIYETIRANIRAGRGFDAFAPWVPAIFHPSNVQAGPAYDELDELLMGVLQPEDIGEATVQPAADMVFYQPTPARHILDLIARTGLTEQDFFVDLGAGLGHVPILISICTDARSEGIELEPSYVRSARKCADSLALNSISFLEEDARSANFEDGTVFYLYTPFTGEMLRSVLNLLRREGERREIRICTFGPCTLTVAEENWLAAEEVPEPNRISIFRSRNRTLS